MSDLVAFLRARLDEDEVAARACADYDGNLSWFDSPVGADPGSHTIRTVDGNRPVARIRNVDSLSDDGRTLDPNAQATHIARHDPARVLREVDFKRGILREVEPTTYLLHEMAAIYRDHPDYNPAWDQSTAGS